MRLILFEGGSIGTGLFVGSGSALHSGGPAGVLIAWILIGAMLINVTQVKFLFAECESVGSLIVRLLEKCLFYTPYLEGFIPWPFAFWILRLHFQWAGTMSSNGPSFFR